jgi:hypothetical protein
MHGQSSLVRFVPGFMTQPHTRGRTVVGTCSVCVHAVKFPLLCVSVCGAMQIATGGVDKTVKIFDLASATVCVPFLMYLLSPPSFLRVQRECCVHP